MGKHKRHEWEQTDIQFGNEEKFTKPKAKSTITALETTLWGLVLFCLYLIHNIVFRN